MCCREWSATYGMNGHKIYIRKYSFRVNRLNPTFFLHYKINEKISTTTFWTFSFRQLHAMLTTPITRHFFYDNKTEQNNKKVVVFEQSLPHITGETYKERENRERERERIEKYNPS